MIHRYQQPDPKSITNPVNVPVPDGRVLVYHGTNSQSAEQIESIGFRRNALPYSFDDVLLVKNAYELLQFDGFSGGGIAVLGVFSTGAANQWIGDKRPGFAFHFETARNYATVRGGETIASLLTSIEEFRTLVGSPELLAAHITKLERDMRRPFPPGDPSVGRIRHAISACRSRALMSTLLSELESLYEKYLPFRQNHKAVVFALSTEADWFEPPAGPGGVNLRAVVDLPPECLVARVDFPNGAEYVDLETRLGPDGTLYFVAASWQRNRSMPP